MVVFRFLRLLFYRAVKWLSGRISEPNYLILASAVIGLVGGLVAVGLKALIVGLRTLIVGSAYLKSEWWLLILPGAGILAGYLLLRLASRGTPVSIGLPPLIRQLAENRIRLPRIEMFAHVGSSALTVGLGGSAGLEAPIIRTGSAIGANLANILQVGRRQQTLLLACGAASGMAAIFNSPVAGVIFAFEALVTNIALRSFIPLLIASATGTLVSKVLYYEQLFFLPAPEWTVANLPFFILLGICCGFYAVYLIRFSVSVSSRVETNSGNWWRWGSWALLLGLLILAFPPLFGEGYLAVNMLLTGDLMTGNWTNLPLDLRGNDWLLMCLLLVILLAKTPATGITMGLGGNGGIFAAVLFSGSFLGYLFAHLTTLSRLVAVNEANFIALGMAGMLSAVVKTPLTAIFLIAEITGGYSLFVPLMIISALAYFVSLYFEPQSIFTRELYRKGLWVPSHERDLQVLQQLRLSDLVERDFAVVRHTDSLGDLVQAISHSRRNIFPVLGLKDELLGVILLDDVRELMFQQDRYDEVGVGEIMHRPPAVVELSEPMHQVMEKFEYHDAWNLPVVNQGRYEGFLSKSTIFSAYRGELQKKELEG